MIAQIVDITAEIMIAVTKLTWNEPSRKSYAL